MAGFLARIVRQRYCPMKRIKQIPSVDVLHLMIVFVGVVTERAAVVPEFCGSFCVGVPHGVSGHQQLRTRLRTPSYPGGDSSENSHGAARSAF